MLEPKENVNQKLANAIKKLDDITDEYKYAALCLKIADMYNALPKNERPSYDKAIGNRALNDWYCTDCESDEDANGYEEYIKILPIRCEDDYAVDPDFDENSTDDLKVVKVCYEHVYGPIENWYSDTLDNTYSKEMYQKILKKKNELTF